MKPRALLIFAAGLLLGAAAMWWFASRRIPDIVQTPAPPQDGGVKPSTATTPTPAPAPAAPAAGLRDKTEVATPAPSPGTRPQIPPAQPPTAPPSMPIGQTAPTPPGTPSIREITPLPAAPTPGAQPRTTMPGSPPGANPSAPPSAEEAEIVALQLDQVSLMLRDYRSLMGANPVGTNAEIMKALMGGNPKNARLGPPEGQSLNAQGELVDRWGTPYFFHQMSASDMEIRSAGPDRTMGTSDDVIHR